MADTTTTDTVAQAQAIGDRLLNELQATVSGQPMPPTSVAPSVAGSATQRIRQIAEDRYWTLRRQMEQAIAARRSASRPALSAEERIAQIKQQLGS